MIAKTTTTLCLAALVAVAMSLSTTARAELLTYTFQLCGAPNSYEPGWVPNGDPNVNGEITLIIDSEQGLLSLEPSQELLDSIRYPDPRPSL